MHYFQTCHESCLDFIVSLSHFFNHVAVWLFVHSSVAKAYALGSCGLSLFKDIIFCYIMSQEKFGDKILVSYIGSNIFNYLEVEEA